MIKDVSDKYNNPDPRIKWARAYNDKLMLHVHGIGLEAALERINNYENEEQKIARDKFAISNKFVTDRLLRPTDNIFSAKGGYVNYVFKTSQKTQEKEFKTKLNDIYSGYSLSQYIHRIWFDKFIVDPNGLIFLEVEEDGSNIYPTYKSIYSIRNYKQDGIRVHWVVFEPDVTIFDDEKKRKNIKAEYFWAVDAESYYRYVKTKDGIDLVGSPITHSFGHVPAIICSDIEDHVTGWKLSPIDKQVELLNKYMVDNSVLNIVEFFHNYPLPWEYEDDCPRCHGTGEVQARETEHGLDTSCPRCNGSGISQRKDPTDKLRIKPPVEGEASMIPPGGYITLPPESWKLKTNSVDRTWDMIMFSQWGAVMEYGSQNGNQYATATGRWTDTQPVDNRLCRYTESVQLIHNAIAGDYGIFYFPETFVSSNVIYGKTYLIATADQLLKSYNESANLGQNPIVLDIVFDKYLETEFKDNEQLYEYHKKIAALDPFPHFKMADLVSMGLPEEIKKKLYVLEYKNNRTIGQVNAMTQDELNKDFENYILKKNLKSNDDDAPKSADIDSED